MSVPTDGIGPELDVDELLLIVVGAHLRAEVADRPLAYRLRERILRWIDERSENEEWSPGVQPLETIVCTDLWYLNNEELFQRPTIALGAPGVNAATAFFANRLPIAFVLEGALQVQLDVELETLWACLWGIDVAATASAADLFAERYLERYLLRAHGEPPDAIDEELS